MPKAKAAEVAEEVKKQFGHAVGVNQISMIKTKKTMKANRAKGRRVTSSRNGAARQGPQLGWKRLNTPSSSLRLPVASKMLRRCLRRLRANKAGWRTSNTLAPW